MADFRFQMTDDRFQIADGGLQISDGTESNVRIPFNNYFFIPTGVKCNGGISVLALPRQIADGGFQIADGG